MHEDQNDCFYRLASIQTEHDDVAETFGQIYAHSGFVAESSVDTLEKSLEEYSLYIGVQTEGQWYLLSTDTDLAVK